MGKQRAKNLSWRRHENGGGFAVRAEAAPEEQFWLGSYPVRKALPTFENLTLGELRGTIIADQPPMTQKELDECAEIRREVRGRIRRARKAVKRKERLERTRKKQRNGRWEGSRKKRRMARERNKVNHRALGLPSHREFCRSVEQRREADNTSPPPEEMVTSPKSKGEDDPVLKGDEDEWEDSDDEDMSNGEDSDDIGGLEGDEHGASDGMEYDDASGELVPIPRKWGKWFKLVRKDDEEDGSSREFPGGMTE